MRSRHVDVKDQCASRKHLLGCMARLAGKVETRYYLARIEASHAMVRCLSEAADRTSVTKGLEAAVGLLPLSLFCTLKCTLYRANRVKSWNPCKIYNDVSPCGGTNYRIFAIIFTVMVSKVTVNSTRYTNILMGTVQAAIANGVLDAVRAGIIPKDKANDLGIIYSVWLDPSVTEIPSGDLDHKALFDVHREATVKVLRKAMNHEPTLDWLLENQDSVTHYFHQLGVNGEL